MIEVEAWDARESDYVTGGMDVDISITGGDGAESWGVDGEVTLVRDHQGDWVPYGVQPNTWVSGGMLDAIRSCDRDTMRLLLGEIAATARIAIESDRRAIGTLDVGGE